MAPLLFVVVASSRVSASEAENDAYVLSVRLERLPLQISILQSFSASCSLDSF
jgi:hypothetical protein